MVEIAYVAGLLVGSAIRGIYTKPYKKLTVSEDRKSATDTVLLILSSLGLFFVPFLYLITSWFDFADYALPLWAGWAGVAIFAAALWLLWRSHADLGRNWTPTLQVLDEHALVTGGVFGAIRHPMYAAHLLWGIAQVLLLQNWIAGPSMLATMLPVYVYRAPREEQMMLDHFGEAYRSYMNHTGRLLPRLKKSDS